MKRNKWNTPFFCSALRGRRRYLEETCAVRRCWQNVIGCRTFPAGRRTFNVHFLTSPFVLASAVRSTFCRLDLLAGVLLKIKHLNYSQTVTQIQDTPWPWWKTLTLWSSHSLQTDFLFGVSTAATLGFRLSCPFPHRNLKTMTGAHFSWLTQRSAKALRDWRLKKLKQTNFDWLL